MSMPPSQRPGRPRGGPPRNGDHDWLLASGFRWYGRRVQWLPLLIELQAVPGCHGADARTFALWVDRLRSQGNAAWVQGLRIPDMYRLSSARLQRAPRFIAVLMHRDLLMSVSRGQGPAASMRRYDIGRPVDCLAAAAAPPLPAPAAPAVGSPPQVIVGVVDEGIGFAHERLLASDLSTRVEYLWDQQVPQVAWGDLSYGRELSKHKADTGFDALMSACSAAGHVDEDEVYRRSGFDDRTLPGHQPLAARASHGAHVADLACRLASLPAPGQRPIIAVNLPPAAVDDTSGALLRPHIFNALIYMLTRADALALRWQTPPLPLVVNISYGLTSGPHDGTDPLEAAIDDLLQSCDPQVAPLRVVLPAGNSRQLRGHARFGLAPGHSRTLPWRLLPDDRSASRLEVWLPAGANAAHFTVQPLAPDGTAASPPAAVGQSMPLKVGGVEVGWIEFTLPPQTSRPSVAIRLAPNADPEAQSGLAPAGLWQIHCHWRGATRLTGVHAWIQRDDTAPGHATRGRQSYFDDPAYRRFDDSGRALADDPVPSHSLVRRRGTISGIATGRQPIVVGGFRSADRTAADYSSAGPGRLPSGGPDAMLPVDDTPSHPGRLGAGTRSGSCLAMHGTSVAAPEAAAGVAEWLAASQASDRAAVVAAAVAELALEPPPSVPLPPPDIGGGGRLPAAQRRRPRYEP